MSRRSSTSAQTFDMRAFIQKIEVDHRISLSYYYRMADTLLKQANVHREEKNMVNLYVTLLSFSSLVSETIPFHPRYQSSSHFRERTHCRMQLYAVLDELEALNLKPELRYRVREIMNKACAEAKQDQSKGKAMTNTDASHTILPPETSSWSPTGGRYPPYRMDAEEYKEECKMCAEKAMTFFNQFALKQGGVTYEIMGYGKSSKISRPEAENCWVFHCNFEARPHYYHSNREAKANDESESESEMSLFFGELIKLDHDGPYVVTQCTILGPAGRVYTGIAGCDPVSRDAINHSTHP